MDNSKSTPEQQQQGQSSTSRRRRSSGPTFETLMNYKRSNDPSSIARRASLNEQKPQSGFFDLSIITNLFSTPPGRSFHNVTLKAHSCEKWQNASQRGDGFSSAESEMLAPEQSSFCRG
ncbi:hypothetical protein F5B18DRAFT_657158 [Nemania serpens]|nr:hypothetical protein F5B18DRAFT_657158 [Nemania serpens]